MREPGSAPAASISANALAGGLHNYALSSDLARLALPQEFRETHRRLAWVNSICFLFLVVGIVGLKPPPVVYKPLSKLEEIVPVILTPPPEQPKPEPQTQPDDIPETRDVNLDTPQVITVVAAADPSQVAFAVPVQGAVAVAAAKFATPPPPADYTPPKPVKFNPNISDGGNYPPPQYPGFALRNRYQGTVLVEIKVDASGKVVSADVRKTAGFSVLDEAAVEVVKRQWIFPPGKERLYLWECTFNLR
jgi:protein TonB